MSTKIPSKADQYYEVLKHIVSTNSLVDPHLSILLGLDSTNDPNELKRIIDDMKKLEFIIEIPGKSVGENACQLLPKGFSTYLTLSSQKQAEYYSIKALKQAKWALWASFAALLFNILIFLYSKLT